MADFRDTFVNTLIGEGSAVQGDLDVDGMLRIDGDFRGAIRALGKVVIGARARVEASIRANSAIIGGVVKGDVYVTESLRLLEGSIVVGNIFAPWLEAEDGAVVTGLLSVTGRPESAEVELHRFVAAHGDALRFLGQFREHAGGIAVHPGGKGPSAAAEEGAGIPVLEGLSSTRQAGS